MSLLNCCCLLMSWNCYLRTKRNRCLLVWWSFRWMMKMLGWFWFDFRLHNNWGCSSVHCYLKWLFLWREVRFSWSRRPRHLELDKGSYHIRWHWEVLTKVAECCWGLIMRFWRFYRSWTFRWLIETWAWWGSRWIWECSSHRWWNWPIFYLSWRWWGCCWGRKFFLFFYLWSRFLCWSRWIVRSWVYRRSLFQRGYLLGGNILRLNTGRCLGNFSWS